MPIHCCLPPPGGAPPSSAMRVTPLGPKKFRRANGPDLQAASLLSSAAERSTNTDGSAWEMWFERDAGRFDAWPNQGPGGDKGTVSREVTCCFACCFACRVYVPSCSIHLEAAFMTFAWNLMSSEQKRSKLLSDVSPQWGETIVGRDVPFTFRPNQVNSSAVELRKWLLFGGGDNILSNF